MRRLKEEEEVEVEEVGRYMLVFISFSDAITTVNV